MVDKNYIRMIKAYNLFLKRIGYEVIYNGCVPNDSQIFFVLEIPNKDNQNEPKFAFLNAFTGAPLSLDGFQETVIKNNQVDDFIKMVDARVKGCTISKTDVIFGILQETNLTIDDIYKDNKLKLTPDLLKVVSQWVNFKGGRNPVMVTRTK